jgi:hypothetical protein
LNFFFCLVLPVGLLATPCLGTAGKWKLDDCDADGANRHEQMAIKEKETTCACTRLLWDCRVGGW